MVRVSASILGFLFKAKALKESDNVMIDKINNALKNKSDKFQILHLDIEDGVFVKYNSFTPQMVHKIKCAQKKEAHLMVVDYKKYLKDFFILADMFIIHNEVLKSDFPTTIEFLHKNKKFVGISINPDTAVEHVKHLDKIDLVLVMSVHPGLPGQKFIEHSINKIKKLNELREKHKYHYLIEVDGGIDNIIAEKCSDAGADIVVMGSHLFR
jgi:ribulose-phosphate 3-epimerase